MAFIFEGTITYTCFFYKIFREDLEIRRFIKRMVRKTKTFNRATFNNWGVAKW